MLKILIGSMMKIWDSNFFALLTCDDGPCMAMNQVIHKEVCPVLLAASLPP